MQSPFTPKLCAITWQSKTHTIHYLLDAHNYQRLNAAYYVLMQIKLRIKQLIAKTRTAFEAACSLYNDFEECESDSDDMDTDSDDSEDDIASY